jgi:isopenicillin N synthase-like dioxygenase
VPAGRVPVLDLERFATDRENLATEAGRAYREYGFCGFVNHGVPDPVIGDAYRVFRQFFAQPEDVKMRYRSRSGGQRGYTSFGIEQAKDGTVPDLKEFWHVGRETGEHNPWPDILEPNRWPTEVPGFRDSAGAAAESYLIKIATVPLDDGNPDLLYDPDEFDRWLPDFDIVERLTGFVRLEEGVKHRGLAQVVRWTGRKR